jgi:hypothetical protein
MQNEGVNFFEQVVAALEDEARQSVAACSEMRIALRAIPALEDSVMTDSQPTGCASQANHHCGFTCRHSHHHHR